MMKSVLSIFIFLFCAMQAQAHDEIYAAQAKIGFEATAASVTAYGYTVVVEPVPGEFEGEMAPQATLYKGELLIGKIKGSGRGNDRPLANAYLVAMDKMSDGPALFFESYTGGAHCCMQTQILTEFDDKWQEVDAGTYDGGGGNLSDADFDGFYEMVLRDNSFLYAFSCYACSATPTQVMRLEKGKLIDVSGEPAYDEVHKRTLRDLDRWGAENADVWQDPGFVAGWVAAMIRAKQGAEAWQKLLEVEGNIQPFLDNDEGKWDLCLKPLNKNAECPVGANRSVGFPTALKHFLVDHGYWQVSGINWKSEIE